jgi:hypothetical protein
MVPPEARTLQVVLFSYTDVESTVAEHALLLLFVGWWLLKRRRGHPGAHLKHQGLS